MDDIHPMPPNTQPNIFVRQSGTWINAFPADVDECDPFLVPCHKLLNTLVDFVTFLQRFAGINCVQNVRMLHIVSKK